MSPGGIGDTRIIFFLIFLSEDIIVRGIFCRFHKEIRKQEVLIVKTNLIEEGVSWMRERC